MFLDLNRDWPPTPPRRPSPLPPRISKRDERRLMTLVGFGLVLVFIAPIGGATLWDPIVAFFRP